MDRAKSIIVDRTHPVLARGKPYCKKGSADHRDASAVVFDSFGSFDPFSIRRGNVFRKELEAPPLFIASNVRDGKKFWSKNFLAKHFFRVPVLFPESRISV